MMKLDFVKSNVIHNGTFHFIVDCSICIIGFFMFVAVVYLAIQILIPKKDYTENIKLLRMYMWDAYITVMLLLAIKANSIYTFAIAGGSVMFPVLLYENMFGNLVPDKIMMYKFIFWILLVILSLIDKGGIVI